MLTSALRQTDGFDFDGAMPRPHTGAVNGRLERPARIPVRREEKLARGTASLECLSEPKRFAPSVDIAPIDIAKRHSMNANGVKVEIVQMTRLERMKTEFNAPAHLLILTEHGMRQDGETSIEGLPRSTLRDCRRKLTFVPAGHDYSDWQLPRSLTPTVYIYLDPASLAALSSTASFKPRLFFEDTALLETAKKLASLIARNDAQDRLYFEALGSVLMHELARLGQAAPRREPACRGGLAAWQERIVQAYIEEHLDEPILLATFSSLVRLSPYYFCRAFKQSFGMPPHRYHTHRRIERAKTLLAKPNPSVTEIGLAVGFSETSSFTAAFRRATGLTPTAYHRSLS